MPEMQRLVACEKAIEFWKASADFLKTEGSVEGAQVRMEDFFEKHSLDDLFLMAQYLQVFDTSIAILTMAVVAHIRRREAEEKAANEKAD